DDEAGLRLRPRRGAIARAFARAPVDERARFAERRAREIDRGHARRAPPIDVARVRAVRDEKDVAAERHRRGGAPRLVRNEALARADAAGARDLSDEEERRAARVFADRAEEALRVVVRELEGREIDRAHVARVGEAAV